MEINDNPILVFVLGFSDPPEGEITVAVENWENENTKTVAMITLIPKDYDLVLPNVPLHPEDVYLGEFYEYETYFDVYVSPNKIGGRSPRTS